MLGLGTRGVDSDYHYVSWHNSWAEEDDLNYYSSKPDTAFPPGEDLWNKFECMLTPPLSPPRLPTTDEPIVPSIEYEQRILLEEVAVRTAALPAMPHESHRIKKPIKDFLIRDCMWGNGSSLTATQEVTTSDTTVTKIGSDQTVTQETAVSSALSFPPANGNEKKEQVATSSDLPCVAPLVDHSHYAAPVPPTPPPSAVCSSESDEEIDVVTVDNQRAKKRAIVHHAHPARLASTRPAPPRVTQLPPPAKRPRVASAPACRSVSPAARPSTTFRPARIGRLGRRSTTKSSGSGKGQRRQSYPRRRGGGPRSVNGQDESDTEVDAKRNTHNVMERMRRDGQRNMFGVLRLCVPDIKDNEKSPKVVILKKATECVLKLTADEERLTRELEYEQRRFRALKFRLTALNQGSERLQ